MNDQGRFLRDVWRCIAARATPPVDVNDIDAWRQRVAHNAQTEHLDRARALILFVPDATPAAVAHAITHRLMPHQLIAGAQQAPTLAAQSALMARNADPACEHCRDTGWIDVQGTATPCVHPDEPYIPAAPSMEAIEDMLAAARTRLRGDT